MTKFETVCITRAGLNFLHAEDVDLAARVTRHAFSQHDDRGTQSLDQIRSAQVLFIPRFGVWG